MTLICFSRAPIDRLAAYKQRMGWQFPYVSTYDTDFPFDFGLAMTEEQAQQIPEVKEMIDNPPDWLQEWSRQVGAELKDGLREGPSWIAFARENGTVYHTYTVMAPDPFVAPVLQLPARPHAEGPARGAARLAQGRVPGLNFRGGYLRRSAESPIVNLMVQYQTTVDRAFAALADPTRRAVLERLGSGSATISELAEPFGMSLTGMKKHVRLLEEAELVTTEKVGRVRRCMLAPYAFEGISTWLQRLDRFAQVVERTKGDR